MKRSRSRRRGRRIGRWHGRWSNRSGPIVDERQSTTDNQLVGVLCDLGASELGFQKVDDVAWLARRHGQETRSGWVATSVHEEVRDDLLNDGTDLARMPQGVDDLLVG